MTKKGRKKTIRLQKSHIIASAIILVLAVMFVFGISYLYDDLFFVARQADVVEESAEAEYRHPLTGVWTYEEVEALPQVYGVMIENHYDARPQAGLDEAFLVIEAPVEAGISRMLAFYHEDQEVDKIGPVRSARPYYVDWSHGLDVMYVHVGGSPDALDQIATDGTYDLNEYWYGGTYFWRSTDRLAPHNVYTSMGLLTEAHASFVEQEKAPEHVYETWNFKDPSLETVEEPVNVWLYFSIYDWNDVYWEYDTDSARYKRYHQDDEHQMESGDQILADNVIIVLAEIEVIDEVGRRSIETISEGVAYVMQDGKVIEATWEKETKSDRLRFYDEAGEEITMNAGVTWIEVLEGEEEIEFVTE